MTNFASILMEDYLIEIADLIKKVDIIRLDGV